MAEKHSGKKEQQQQQQQQKNKKKQNEKKKNQENGVKRVNEQPANHKQNHAYIPQKKKDKSNKNSSKASKKKSVSNSRSFFWTFIIRSAFIFLALGFLHLVDPETFTKLKNGAGFCFSKIINLLPSEVVAKGKQMVDFVRPPAEVVFSKLGAVLKETSTFFNTNPLVKDHWVNIKEIGSISGARLVDYMRTVYLQITGYCLDFKNKLFQ